MYEVTVHVFVYLVLCDGWVDSYRLYVSMPTLLVAQLLLYYCTDGKVVLFPLDVAEVVLLI